MNYKDDPEKMTALLKRWTKPGHEHLDKILTVCADRGADEWHTIAANGQVLITLRYVKHPEGAQPAFGVHFPAEWYWCFTHIERNECIEPAKRSLIERVPAEVRAAIASDPDLGLVEWVRIKRLNYTSYGSRGVRAMHKPAPADVLFFRFNGGLGLAVCDTHKV